MGCTSRLVASSTKSAKMKTHQDSILSAQLLAAKKKQPDKSAGLSRFYKSKSQSFRSLSDAMNSEHGESARGLAKRVKIWHQETEPCRMGSDSGSDETCSRLMSLSVHDPEGSGVGSDAKPSRSEMAPFQIGSSTLSSRNNRTRRRNVGRIRPCTITTR